MLSINNYDIAGKKSIKPSLYNLAAEYQQLENDLFYSLNDETGEVSIDISQALDRIHGTFENKAIAVATVWRDFDDYISRIKAGKERLTALEKRVEREQKRVEDYLTQACEMTGTESIRGVYANISFRSNPLKTIIDDEDLIPEEYITVKVERKPNLTAIKEAIKSGKEVAGAHLESERKIQIK